MENSFKVSPREIKRYQTTGNPLQYFNLINSYSAAELSSSQQVVCLYFYYCDANDCKEKDRGLLFCI